MIAASFVGNHTHSCEGMLGDEGAVQSAPPVNDGAATVAAPAAATVAVAAAGAWAPAAAAAATVLALATAAASAAPIAVAAAAPAPLDEVTAQPKRQGQSLIPMLVQN